MENVVFDDHTREVDYSDKSVTGELNDSIMCFIESRLYISKISRLWQRAENTRASYPIEFIPNAKIPCVGPHPKNIILLACDAFGVLPPVSKLTLEQTMYHFISGYTALVSALHTCFCVREVLSKLLFQA